MYHNSESEIYLDLTNCLTAHKIVRITFLNNTFVSCNLVNVNVEICCLPPPSLFCRCCCCFVVVVVVVVVFLGGSALVIRLF